MKTKINKKVDLFYQSFFPYLNNFFLYHKKNLKSEQHWSSSTFLKKVGGHIGKSLSVCGISYHMLRPVLA